MAASSSKKTAATNKTKLDQLHTILAANVFILLLIWYFKRPQNIKPVLFFQIPLAISEAFLEKTGRPKYQFDPISGYNKLVKSGLDLSQAGFNDYVFDLIYLTWILNILVLIFGSNKIWYLWLIVPVYVAYNLFGFIKPFLPQLKEKAAVESKPEKSKRQQKLEKNGRRKVVRQ